MINQRLEKVVKLCQHLAKQDIAFDQDKITDSFCHQYLRDITLAQLQAKVANELSIGTWRALGKVLVVVSEKDALASLLTMLSAFITGNRIHIKTRHSKKILQACKSYLGLNDSELFIEDWFSQEQNSAVLLKDVQAVLLVGSDELIGYYRCYASYPIRLIEYGPKISAALLLKAKTKQLNSLIEMASVFRQKVSSSPYFIMLDENLNIANIFGYLAERLADLPALDKDAVLAQANHYQQLKLLQKLDSNLHNSAFNPQTGWGVSVSQGIQPHFWFKQGLNLCIGSPHKLLNQAAKQWAGQLQTLGIAGNYSANVPGFSRVCALNLMHHRPLTAAHDGFFELAALVHFYHDERNPKDLPASR